MTCPARASLNRQDAVAERWTDLGTLLGTPVLFRNGMHRFTCRGGNFVYIPRFEQTAVSDGDGQTPKTIVSVVTGDDARELSMGEMEVVPKQTHEQVAFGVITPKNMRLGR